MGRVITAFSGVSVDNLKKAKEFYTTKLKLEVADEEMGIRFVLPGGGNFYIYEKKDHLPASYTCLNFVVEDIDEFVDMLVENGVVMERYENMPAPQDHKGILRGLSIKMGPDIAWFTDPAGNIISAIQDK